MGKSQGVVNCGSTFSHVAARFQLAEESPQREARVGPQDAVQGAEHPHTPEGFRSGQDTDDFSTRS